MNAIPPLFLGTALWGWGVGQAEAFSLLDAFYAAGYRGVDTASNYPIDKNGQHFRLAENWLNEWARAHGVTDLQIIAKVGAMDNQGGNTANLTPSFLLMSADHYQRLFGNNLKCLMLHWDPRDQPYQIAETLDACRSWRAGGLEIGLSGIAAPQLYADGAPELQDVWWIEMKHNVLDEAAYATYAPFHGQRRFIAYGLNAGGIAPDKQYDAKSSATLRGKTPPANLPSLDEYLHALPADLPARPQDFNQLNMYNAYIHPDIASLIIGPRTMMQLQDSLDYFKTLQEASQSSS